MVEVGRHDPGVSSTEPRATSSVLTPRRFTATRATAETDSWGRSSDCTPRTRTCRPPTSSSSPTPIVPSPSVPVTTVPLPRIVNTRSTHSRTRPVVTGAGSDATRRSRASRRESMPSPVLAETATASHSPRLEADSRSPASASVAEGSARSLRVTTSSPCRMPSASTAARCSPDCWRHPSSAATTNTTAGAGPMPASMLPMKRWCPGTSTKATSWPDGRVVQA